MGSSQCRQAGGGGGGLPPAGLSPGGGGVACLLTGVSPFLASAGRHITYNTASPTTPRPRPVILRGLIIHRARSPAWPGSPLAAPPAARATGNRGTRLAGLVRAAEAVRRRD